MKSAVIFCSFLVAVCAKEVTKTKLPENDQAAALPEASNPVDGITARLFRRNLKADILRDFPGFCFASTQCRVYKEGEYWSLEPFCGMAKCISEVDADTGNVTFVEQVSDCGLLPKENPKCKNTNAENSEAAFPTCCPVFVCDEGVVLEYPESAGANEPPTPLKPNSEGKNKPVDGNQVESPA